MQIQYCAFLTTSHSTLPALFLALWHLPGLDSGVPGSELESRDQICDFEVQCPWASQKSGPKADRHLFHTNSSLREVCAHLANFG